MKSFLKMMLASTLGVIIASVVVTVFSLFILIGVSATMGSERPYNLQDGTILKINLKGTISERENQSIFDFFNSEAKYNYGLNDIVSAIKKAKDNDKIKGIFIEAGYISSGYSILEPVRKALTDFKTSGKFIIAYGDMFSQGSYYASSVADEIYLNPLGTLDFRGLASSIQFDRGFYEKLGIEWQVYKVGTYKSAVEPYISDKMSDANREQTSSFLHDIWSCLLKGISENRQIPVEKLNQYADECLTFADPQKSVDYKLIDGLKYKTEIESYLKEKLALKETDKLKLADVKELRTIPGGEKKISKDKIAVLFAEGEIISDDMPSFLNNGSDITAKEYIKEINKLKNDNNVKAVVFRVNSPGGSAFASEQIYQAVKTLNETKPVVVSMGNYAASGGYYISCGARKIVAEPTTITGSIGIFGLIPNGAALSQKLGATHDGVSTNKHSNLTTDVLRIPLFGLLEIPARPFDAEESVMLQAYIERGYDLFIGRCSEGRGKTKAEIDAIGQGRVWTGKQALELGLVDKLGGIDDAVKVAAELAGIDDYSVGEYPAKKDFLTQLLEESTENVEVRLMEGIIGKETYRQKQLLKAQSKFDCRQAITPIIIN
jgi:protease-4